MTRAASLAFLTAAVLAAACLPACNIIGPAAYIVAGPGTIDAQYVPPDVTTVVYIDDRANVVNPTTLRRVIGDRTSVDLMQKKVLTETISPADALATVSLSDHRNQLMPIDEIGRTVGADQVIYVEMLAFQSSPDGATPSPFAVCQVRVIDAVNKKRLFPGEESDLPSVEVRAMLREVDPSVFRDRTARLKVFNELAEELGGNIAKLFYKHERVELGSRLEPR